MDSDKESTQHEDDQVLLENTINTNGFDSHSKHFFLLAKVLTLILFLISLIFNFQPYVTIILNFVIGIIDFWLCKNKFGLNLVGLQWYLDFGNGGNPKWVFYSRPDPYIPDPGNVNIFWGFLYAFTFLWFMLFILTLISKKYSGSFTCLLLFALSIVNVLCFKRCEVVQSQQADEVARTIMLGDEFSSDKLDPEEGSDDEIPEIEHSGEDGKIELKLPSQNPKEE